MSLLNPSPSKFIGVYQPKFTFWSIVIPCRSDIFQIRFFIINTYLKKLVFIWLYFEGVIRFIYFLIVFSQAILFLNLWTLYCSPISNYYFTKMMMNKKSKMRDIFPELVPVFKVTKMPIQPDRAYVHEIGGRGKWRGWGIYFPSLIFDKIETLFLLKARLRRSCKRVFAPKVYNIPKTALILL